MCWGRQGHPETERCATCMLVPTTSRTRESLLSTCWEEEESVGGVVRRDVELDDSEAIHDFFQSFMTRNHHHLTLRTITMSGHACESHSHELILRAPSRWKSPDGVALSALRRARCPGQGTDGSLHIKYKMNSHQSGHLLRPLHYGTTLCIAID